MKHALAHFSIQPGQYGRPMLEYDLNDFLLDLLHLAELGVPKTPWKHGILNNASDDARELISERLKDWKHPLDCRRKDDNRCRAGKWFTGEAWASFCAGHRGSPGGPRAIAEIVKIIADDMTTRGVSIGSGTKEEEEAEEEARVEKAEAAAAGGGGETETETETIRQGGSCKAERLSSRSDAEGRSWRLCRCCPCRAAQACACPYRDGARG